MKLSFFHKFLITVGIYIFIALAFLGIYHIFDPPLDESDLTYTEGVCVGFDYTSHYKSSSYYSIELDDGVTYTAFDADLASEISSVPDLTGKKVKIGYNSDSWFYDTSAVHLECEGIKYKTVDSYNEYNSRAITVFECALLLVFLVVGGWFVYDYMSLHHLREQKKLREGYTSVFSIKYKTAFDLRQMESLLLSRKQSCRVGFCKRVKKKNGKVAYGILYIDECFAIQHEGKRYVDVWISKEQKDELIERITEFLRLTCSEIDILCLCYDEKEIAYKDITPELIKAIVYN